MVDLWHFIQEFWGLLFGAGGAFATFMFYKQNKRLKNAEAFSKELDNFKGQTEHQENRLQQRDAKIDALYIDLRKAEEKCLQLTEELGRVKLDAELSKVWKCEKRGCTGRIPPNGY